MLTAVTSPIRLRALRAAQVASLSATLVSISACPGTTAEPDAARSPDAPATVDAFSATADASSAQDAPVALTDAFSASDVGTADDAPDALVVDAGNASDAGCTASPPVTQECCVLADGFWDAKSMFCAIAVPGPFVPPSLNV